MDSASVRAWLREFARLIADNKVLLTELDSAIGDADHGTNMDRGMSAVVASLDPADGGEPSEILKKAGMTLVSKVGGASGPLYGTAFLRMAAADPADLGAVLRAGVEGVVARGKASVGDKTMLDALIPAADALDAALASGQSPHDALASALAAGEKGRDGTTAMIARKGRASYLGERSAGHQDPGATSACLLLAAAAATLG